MLYRYLNVETRATSDAEKARLERLGYKRVKEEEPTVLVDDKILEELVEIPKVKKKK